MEFWDSFVNSNSYLIFSLKFCFIYGFWVLDLCPGGI